MKKLLISLSIILCLSLIFVACNKNKESDTDTESATKKNPTEVTDTAETTLAASDNTTTNTEEASDVSASEEATTVASTEETSADATETTTEIETSNMEDVIKIMSYVDEAMDSLEYFERTEISDTYFDGESTGADKTVTKFDGYYAYVANYYDDEMYCNMYLIDNIILYTDDFSTDIVIYLSQNEYLYVLDEMIFLSSSDDEEGTYEQLCASFKTVSLTDDGSQYTLEFSNPTDEFIASVIGETGMTDIEISGVSYLFKINYDYTVSVAVTDITMSFMGMEATNTTTIEYSYEDFTLADEITENFDGYTVVEFQDIFGYIDTSYGADLGLDIDGDNFVLDCNNEERLEYQIDFMDAFIDEFLGKTFTIYGNIFDGDSEYSIEVCNGYAYFDIVLADGVEYLDNGTLACVTGKLCKGDFDYEFGIQTYYFEITSAKAITEDEIPEGGYLPWTAFVTARSLNVRATPDFKSSTNKVGVITADTEIKVVGFVPDRYCMIEYHWETEDGQSGEYAYVSLAYLTKLPSYYLTLNDEYKAVNPPI